MTGSWQTSVLTAGSCYGLNFGDGTWPIITSGAISGRSVLVVAASAFSFAAFPSAFNSPNLVFPERSPAKNESGTLVRFQIVL